MPPESPLLALDGVGKRFPDATEALAHVDLAVNGGEFVGIVGPSGCGKSTLLRLASGLTQPTSGTVTVTADTLGYVFQEPTLLPWRTVRGNVELLGELRGVPAEERRRRVDEALHLVGLEDAADKHPRELSGGMRMRVSLARSLTLHPQVFLFDEPFGALDEITRERLNEELLALFTSQRFAAVFVTHSVTEAVFLSTRVLVMSQQPGRLVGDFDVPFGYPRSPELRFDAAFSRLSGEVSSCLRRA